MQKDKDLKSLDDLVASLGGSGDRGKQSDGSCGLLLEHLRGARSNLLGSMFNEYRASLEDAKGSVSCITDKSARGTTSKALQGLIDAWV